MEDGRPGQAAVGPGDPGELEDVGATDGPDAARPIGTVNEAAEREVLAQWRRRDHEGALRLLMSMYGARVLAFARRHARDDQAAQDVRQQVFLDAWRGMAAFEERSSMWAWLCAITYRRCIDAARRQGRTRDHEVPVDFEVLEARAPASDEVMSVDRLAEQQSLEHCLGQLSPAIRGQVLMRYAEGLSHAEIAEAVGDAPGTVQVRLARVLVKLRRCLQTRRARR